MLRRVRLPLALIGLVSMAACFVENISGRYCNVKDDCTEPGYPKCDTRVKTCVPSTFDFDMGTGGDNDLSMIGCHDSVLCPAAAPVCSAAQVCAPCSPPGASTDCNMYHQGTPLCGPAGGCVECLTKDNCDMIHKTCSPMNTCVACVNNADCTSGLCTAGMCADKATLLYVNNATGAGCSDSGPGSFGMPFCTVQKGLNAAAMAGKTVIVFSGTYAENVQASTTLNGGNDYVATAIGVGTPVVKPPATGVVLSVGGTAGKQVTVSFDGFTFDGSTVTDGSNGVACNGGPGNTFGKTIVTINHSLIKGASGIGLAALADCTVNLDADSFVGDKGGAIKSDTCDLALTNLLIHGNGTSGAGGSSFGGILFAAIGEAGKTNLFNMTVVNNVAAPTANASGILCLAAPTTVANTLVLGNTGPATEISPGCSASYSAYIGATGSNNENIPLTGCGVADLLLDPAGGNFHPKTSGTAPCTLVNQGTNTGAPDHDLDGTSRPQPTSGTDDIGCYETK
ncbi:MAG: putative cell wall binding repeat 2-containing protein [bacterium]|nr:putative cell wall binding repeat 2-containing protein [bacterium]